MTIDHKAIEESYQEGKILLIDKPRIWTSFDIVNKIKVLFKRHHNIRKIRVGHAGTLDPLATGLLIVCIGKFTKRIEEFQEMEKEYTGTIRIDGSTPSFDLETSVDKEFDISHITEELIHNTTKKFIGEIEQMPPVFSANKIDGERACYKARRGEDVVMKIKKVTIHEFKITKIDLPNIDFKIICSKGTYIRSLAKDFGAELNVGGYLTSLCRTRIGNFKLSDAQSIDDFEAIMMKESIKLNK